MLETSETPTIVGVVADSLKRQVLALQNYAQLVFRAFYNLGTPPWYGSDTLDQMDVIGVGSLPIVMLSGLFMGVVLVLQTAAQFERFGETALTGEAVALALVRELGPVISALLVAGRNSSGMASELGSMVVTEQVDAMRALGTDPARKLVVPRIVATTLMMPLLTGIADFVGLCGGYIASSFELKLAASQFWSRAVQSLTFGDIMQGAVKPLVFGLILSSVGCYQGLNVRGGTQGVGRATTTAVVVASVAIIISDTFLSKIFLFLFQKG